MADDILSRLYCSYEKDGWPCEQCTFCAARAEIKRLRRLERYVEHRQTCQTLLGGGRPCSCGLSDLLVSGRD